MYVSDRPGRHNMELLKRMVLPDGSVLLCAQPGRPTLDCLFSDCMRDHTTLLKVRMQMLPSPLHETTVFAPDLVCARYIDCAALSRQILCAYSLHQIWLILMCLLAWLPCVLR